VIRRVELADTANPQTTSGVLVSRRRHSILGGSIAAQSLAVDYL
jgi:hypothetical protein